MPPTELQILLEQWEERTIRDGGGGVRGFCGGLAPVSEKKSIAQCSMAMGAWRQAGSVGRKL